MKKNAFLNSLITSSLSIVPIIVIVSILSLTGITPLPQKLDYAFLYIGMIVLILGLALFSIGAERSLSKVGKNIGTNVSKQTNLWVVVIVVFVLGALITCAEPSIMILSKQTTVPSWLFILFISVGVGLFVVFGVVRVFKHQSLNMWLLSLYGMVFGFLLLLEDKGVVPFIFDGGGATTGSATVPFILALGAGVATVRGGKNSKDDSFGLIAIASVGPLIMLTIMFALSRTGAQSYEITDVSAILNDENLLMRFFTQLIPTFSNGKLNQYGILLEVAMSILPILIIFLVFQKCLLHLAKSQVYKILIGFLFAYFGLVIFLDGVTSVMMPIGQYLGMLLGSKSPWVIFVIAFTLGLVTVLCEPAIHVLTKQIEDVSSGSISKNSVLITLSVGVGIAILLSAIRVVYNFSMLYYLVPGLIISLGMSFYCPKLFTALAFDSGGVASGPMTSSFILPLIVGIAITLTNYDSTQIMGRAFGVVGMVALTPLIGIQILGIMSKVKEQAHDNIFDTGIWLEGDEEIINF